MIFFDILKDNTLINCFVFSRDLIILFSDYLRQKNIRYFFCGSDGGPAISYKSLELEPVIASIEDMIIHIDQVWFHNIDNNDARIYATTLTADENYDEIEVEMTKEYVLKMLIGMLKICIECQNTPDLELRMSAD